MQDTSDSASRASVRRPGRPTVITPENIERLLALIAQGDKETHACILAKMSYSAWAAFKRNNPQINENIEAAKTVAAVNKYQKKQTTLQESNALRQSNRKAKEPKPTHQASMVKWKLITLPLNIVAISDDQIREACRSVNMSYDFFMRQNSVFGIMKKVYERRTEIRGDENAKDLKRCLFPQNPEYRRPPNFAEPVNDYWGLPEGYNVGL
jgi:hypothetical protein